MALKSKYASVCSRCGVRFRINVDWIESEEKGGKRVWFHANGCPQPGQSASGSTVITASKTYRSSDNKPFTIPTIEEEPIVNDLSGAIAEAIEASLSDDKPTEKTFIPSAYQERIFEFIRNGTGHGVVEAVAGSGKTTTIVKALDLTPSTAKVAFVAFNKHIAQELKKRAPAHVHVSTLHSLGLSIIRKTYPKIQIDDDKVGSLLEDIFPVSKQALKEGKIGPSERKVNYAKRFAMRKVVSICKALLVDFSKAALEFDAFQAQVREIIDRYGIEIDTDFISEIIENLPDVMNKCKDVGEAVDFDDMIWLPLVNNMSFEKFDFMFVDEWQDMNISNIEFLLKCLNDNGRMIVVGDKYQSLYAFRGATPEAMDIAINRLHATVLPLSVTYRCPASHVKLAKQIVPQLEARDNAPEGAIVEMMYFDLVQKLQPGDMVICRTNAPLVKPAFECIRAGKKAMIRGRDIGASLVNLVKRFETNELAEFEINLAEYYEKEMTKLLDRGKEMQALLLQDRVETLRFIINESSTVADVINKIELLFSDNNVGIVFSSVHRAKGLEAEKVYILQPELMPHKKAKKDWERQQEMNCLYVAQTRSKDSLFFVRGGTNA